MKDSVVKQERIVKAEFPSQTLENINRVNDISQQIQNVKNIPQALTPSESFWCERLIALQPLQLPFESVGKQAEPKWAMSSWQPSLLKNGEEEAWRTLLQAFVIYLARLTQQTEFQIGWCVNEAKDKPDMLTGFSPVVPMVAEVAFDKPWCAVADWIDDELAQLAQHHTFSCDLLSHSPVLRAIPELTTSRPWRIAVSVIRDDRLCDQEVHGELLTLQINAQGGFRWIYDVNRLSAEVVQRMSEHLQVLISSKVKGDETPIRQLNLLPETERSLLLETWNATETAYPDALCIHQLFEQQAEKTPDAIALVYEEQTLSYAELNARANRLAHQLIELGVGPDQRVAICVSRSPAMVAALLAVLKAGGAYVPLDPVYTGERLAHILTDATPAILLADNTGCDVLGEAVLAGLTVLDPNILPDRPDSNPQVPALTAQHLAYVIYTSGSTGTPKGVMVEHRNIQRLFDATESWYHFNRQDVWCLFHSIAFDFSVWELWGALRYGAKLVLVPHAIARSPQELHQFVCQHGITVLNQTPSAFKAFIASYVANPLPDCLRYIIFGGEALDPIILKPWYALREERSPQLVNMYGITETTVHVTYRELDHHDVARVVSPIGTRIPDLTLYLLDKYGQPVPLGAEGELYVGGAGVARGYLNRPELTAERFLIDPFSDKPDTRMYRTGDLARYLPGGDLEFIGRNDQQVKIRGFRIEPGEIEARLIEYPAVSESVVLAMGDGQDKRLVAYVVARADDELVNSLREHLRVRLPDYMVPSAFVRLDAFPLTPNGKLDRRALPVPGVEAFARQVYEAPQGEMEITLAAIWRELLGIEQISRHDSFFALGGHSLLGVQMIERLRSLGLTLAARDLFQFPVLSELTQTLGRHQAVVAPSNVITTATTELTPAMLPLIDLTQTDIDHIVEQVPGGIANIQDIYALSPLQDGILFHHLLAKEGDPYQLAYPMIFADRELLDRYLAAVQQVINRHDILRTAFIWQGLSAPAQVVWRQAPLSVTELTLNPADGPAGEQLAQRFDPRLYRFELSQAPLLRFAVAQETDGRWHVLQLQHHLIGDRTTMEVMNREVLAHLAGQEDNLPAPASFRNLVAQTQLGESQQEHTHFFTDMLAKVDEPTLPFGLTEVYRDGSLVTGAHWILPPELNDRLRRQARRLEVSLAALCHLAWAQVLSRTSGQEKVVFGTVLFGRMQAGEGADSGMGPFINTLPLRLDMDDTSVRDSVRTAHNRLAELLDHEHASLVLAQRCSGVQRGVPLFSSLFNYRHNTLSVASSEIINGIEFLEEQGQTNYPLVLSMEDFGDALELIAQIVEPFDSERVCGYMQRALESLVEALEQAPETPVRALNILPETERTLLLETWNATEIAYPDELCIHQLFEQQVEKTPDATALVYENQTLSYAELNACANRLAHQLITLGVEPDQRVAICVSRCPAMVVGLLAVLKAGGAYVPLDPVYSGERLTHILMDAAPTILLADNIGRIALGEKVLAEQIVLDPNTLFDQPDSNPQIPALTSQHLAYVIYTSGSTGVPKGVMVEHQGLVNLIRDKITQFAIHASSRMLQFASFGFDASVWEIMMALCGGASLDIPVDIVRQDPHRLWCYLEEQGITHACLTPALLRDGADLPMITIKPTLILGGEAPSVALLRALCGRATLFNAYGPTEITVCATTWHCPSDYADSEVPIGCPTANTRVYLLDADGQPVPLGGVGELYIGGAGVARGYLNRSELTVERFLADPFSDTPDARMYRTGDLARYLPDGNLLFVGRNDQQIKIRGFRIEPGEIEARLIEHPTVREATVLALGDGHDKRLVAYVVAPEGDGLANSLRAHLQTILPDYMVPTAFVQLDAFPLTPNGKLDRQALPAPGNAAFARQVYAAPQGEMEMLLAAIWRELLGIEQVSRYDSFFALGGHSLLAIRMVERLRHLRLTLTVRDLFQSPVLAELAQTLGQHQIVVVPPNVITSATTTLTPAMLPLINLTQPEIDLIVEQVPGGIANIQDIYALSPLQDGILFHHLLANEGDPYLLTSQMAFADRVLLDRYLAAVQQVVDRHDILRTAFIWQGLSVPAQVVLRQATLSVTELVLNPVDGLVSDQLAQRFDPRHYRLDLNEAPLLRFVAAQETDGRWLLLQLMHHLIGDHTTLDVMNREVQAYLAGQGNSLPAPVPFRNLVAQVRLGISQEEHARFFTDMLAGVDEPTLPFGLTEVHRDGSQVTESHRMLTAALNDRLRSQARRLGVSLAPLCHLAWAQVLSRTSGQEKVVFGTVLFGRMQAGDGADSGMGLFINTLPLRLDMDETPVRDSVQAAHTRLAGLLAHEHASLALAQRCSDVQGEIPLFNSLLNYRHSDLPSTSDEIISGIEFLGGQERTNYPLALSVEDFGESLGLTAQAVQPFDPERICGYMQQALESLIEALEHAPETPVRAMNILPEVERELLLETWNVTETEYPDQLCIHQLFEQQAEKNPDATALVYENQTLSYAELNSCANRLAHQLIALGVEPDQRVAICVSRSPAMVVGLLAVLKAGGAYVPLDPAYPGERLAHILMDAAPTILLADNVGRTTLGEKALADLMVIDPNTHSDQLDSNPQIPELTSRHLAYVIYTSGSTGTPKGVMVEHRGVVNLALAQIIRLNMRVTSRMLQFASFGFDASVWEIMIALSSGASLAIPADTVRQDPYHLWSYLEEQAVTHACLTPALLRDGTDLPAITIKPTLVLAGEAPSVALLQAMSGRVNLFNAYGPTEMTVCATTWHCPPDYTDTEVSIGRPIANTRVYLLDADGQPVPLGGVGELYIGGAGVARGYLNRPELTAERFLADPFSHASDARMYRTGDLARYLPDGNLVFVGRNDQQIKIRGFRIEPGEIEARLMEHPAVSEALVVALDEGADKRLVAYVAAPTDDGLINSLRAHLSAVLPDYMVPAAFVRLDAFPLTPNGKLDRRGLPAPSEEAFARQIYEAPQGETEIALAAIWHEVLGIEQISRHDNFFALGGHSLLAVRVMNRIAAFGIELPLTTLFKSPSLKAFAEAVNNWRGEQGCILPAIVPISREGKLPLSFAQQRLWFLAQFEGASDTYHIPVALHLRGQLNIAAWQLALNALFARHEALRSVFVSVDGQPQVQLLAVDSGLPLSQHDLRGLPDAEARLERLCAGEAYTPFDLSSGPLIRASLIRLADDEYQFLLTQHHIVSDGWSVNVLIRELSALYTAFSAAQSDPLPPQAIQYPDYAAWQRQWLSVERVQVQSDYWRTMLADAPVLLDLPTDRPRPSEQSFVGNVVPINLDTELTKSLKHLSEQQGVTLFMTLLSAWAVVLSRLSGQQDLVIGTPSAGRRRQEVESLIGFFVNTLALRMDLSGELTVTELLARVRQTALAAQEHQDLSFEQVVEIVQPPRRLAHTPLFQVMFAWQNNENTEWRLPGLAVSPVEPVLDRVKFDLELDMSEVDDRIVGTLSYASALFDQPTIERQVGYLRTVLQAMVVNPQLPVGEIDILAPVERQLLLETWNATETAYPDPLCVHQLFEQQVEKTPDATALEYQEQTLSYAELNTRANRLAYQLIALGVVPDQRVAICVSRSPAMVVALLAVLKAGGAYVPLDPTYPGERLTHILNDAAPLVVLADQGGRAALGEKMLAALTVFDPNTLPDQPDSNPQVSALTPQHLAYVIYTSGSTGMPKGVMVEHQAVYQRHLGFNETYAVTAQDRVLQFASFAFDASVEEFFSSLCNGATLVIRDDSWLASVQGFITLTRQNRITMMSLPTLFWSELATRNDTLPLPDCLRLVIIGGEAVQKSAIQAWFTQETHRPRLLNTYGPTENTVIATCKEILSPADACSIGRPVKNTCIYLLDRYGQPVPLGSMGEIYIGGVGVARGYLNRPALSVERFMPDPFSALSGTRMYRTGDLARYLPNGNLEFLGRNDQQVKIRGFRIEPGEIETRLAEYPDVRDVTVLALGDGQDKRLVAYVVAPAGKALANSLRTHLRAILPDYMVPSAFVRLDMLPLTPNGKLDRRALPVPDEEAFARQVYEAPQGETEMALATIWRELLGIEQVSRYDSFFALGGHSLLAIRMVERLRNLGLTLAVRDLFQSPVLSELAQTLGQRQIVMVPVNVITPETTAITPEMLPLIDLTQVEIDHIVEQVPGGIANVQDIYALSPLQDGILFHHLLENEGDPYLVVSQMAFAERSLLDRYLAAVQQVVDRHDILRTAFIWQGLSAPAQVVWRQATLSVTELTLEPSDGSISGQLTQRFNPRHHRLDLSKAPLLRFVVAQDTDGRWILLQLQHHLIGDHTTLDVMDREVQAYLAGQGNRLPAPAPFRNLVAQVRLGVSQEEHARFFTDMLAEVDEPTLPFGLTEVYRDGSQVTESHRMLTAGLNDRLRSQARRLGVSLAALCHLAWAQVLSRTSGQEKVVFGTVLFGRMVAGEGADNGMGLFINTLPLRLNIDETPVRDSVQAAHIRLAGLLEHEHASLALAQRCSGVQGEIPLFNSLLNYRHNTLSATSDEIISGIEFLGGQERTNYPFVLSVEDFGESLGLTAQVVQPFDPESLCGYMQQALESLAAALEQTPEIPVRALEILPEAERTLLLKTWNATETAYPDQLCIHQLFEQQVEQTPDAIALVYEEQTFSYAELNIRANRLAHQLIALGVEPDQRVAICVSRSPAMVVGVLAILKAGGAYVPLDPVYTGERLTHIMTDAAPAMVLADDIGRDVLGEKTLAALTVLDPNTLPDQPDSNPQIPVLTSRHLAYVIYTSGSTGTPKGVMVEHRNILRLFEATESWYHFNRQDVWCLFHSIAFDFSVWELWGALRYGAKLVLVPHEIARSPQELHQFVCQHGITVLNQTPSAFKAFIASYAANPLPDQLRYIIFGGEALDPGMLRPWYRLREETSPRLVNMYGITETTVHVTYRELNSHDVEQITSPIGTRIPDLTLYLLDKYGQPVPLGVTGELYVGGGGVARGYLNRPELTAERFLADPFSDQPGARMYRTGDLARYLSDGNLEFLGRNDQQVKIRGFRIEPGEIETRLIEHSAVREAAVLALGDGQDKRLVAYVVAPVNDGLVNSLRTHLSKMLPDYMVPSAFVRLDAFPLTSNGKLDRRALPAPDSEAVARQVYAAPLGETEIALAAIWCELLGIEQVSRHDSFFALGGHSLLAVRMIERLRHLGLTLAVRDLFQSPVLSDLAQTLRQQLVVGVPSNMITPATTTITPAMLPLINLTQPEIDLIIGQIPGGVANIQDIYALSPLQDGILFHHLLASEGDPYLLMGQMAFADRTLLDRYLAAVQQVVDRHDILRTAFIWQGLSGPAQVVLRQAALSVTELALNPADGPVSDQLTRRFDPRQHRLDLNEAPLLRFVAAQETDGRWILLQLQHHLIGDHTTLDIMNREVQVYLAGQGNRLSVPVPFRNLVAQARLGVSQEEHTRFFTDMLAAVDEPTLPFGLTEVHRDGSQVTESHRMLTAALNDRLRSQARHLGVSLAALCHLAWAQVLSRTSGQEKVVFGTVLFGRMQAGEGADNGMGLFINTLPLRLDINNTPVRDSVQAAHTRLAGLLEHEHASLALAQRCSSVQGEIPLFNSLLNYRHNALPVMSDEFISGIEFLSGQERTNYSLTLSMEDFGESLGLTVQAVQPFDPERICGYMQQALESLAEVLEQAPETPVRALNILPEIERKLLLETWNATETAYLDQLCIHQLFEQQVEKNPDATALVYENQTLSYAELNACANRLAHQLIALGVEPDQRVAICVSRSPAMVVGLLAVLKAGGAYVPLDPAYPGERLAHILMDAAPAILLVDEVGRTALGEKVLAEQTVLDPNTLFDQLSSNPQRPTLTSQHLAYVIYTSGSTGTPKGVMIEHSGLVNLIQEKITQFDIHAGSRMLQFASFSFDASVWEIMMALGSGACLDIPIDTVRQDPRRLWYYLEEQSITHACLTPALLRDGADLPAIAIKPTLILGGEAPSAALLGTLCGQATLFNAYGPTEITVCATTWHYPSDYMDTEVPIGRPTANTQIYLLDADSQPVPLGCIGELYIGGAGVARGYLNRPELTAERFLIDPFSDVPNARMYRAGDLARYLPDGNLVFVGRSDQQIKIRGFRIEPGEIEARLTEHPVVREALVLALGDGQNKRLVAYVAASADDGLVNRLRAHLSAVLPDYMVPAAFVRLDAFPLTPNGKLDRRGLPAPSEEAFARQIYEAPQGEAEIALAAIWREILGIEQISRHDNFFALGGHSLLAVRVMNRVAALGIELPLTTLFKSPSLAAFAEEISARLDKQGGTLPAIMSISREGMLPLSFAQQRLWFLAQFNGVSDTYHIPVALHLRGQLDIAAWQQALNALFARHEALRSVFVSVNGQPQVQLLGPDGGLPLSQHDLRGIPNVETVLERLSTEEAYTPFDLNSGPLIRASLIRLMDDEYQFLFTQHHIISDGWSVNVLIRELSALYTAFLAKQSDPLPPLVIQYPDYAAWQRQWLSAERVQVQSDYWRTMLADAPVLLDLPADRPRPSEQSFAGNIVPIKLDAELTTSLKRLSEQHGVTLFMTLLSAWAMVLSRLSGQEDLVIGTPSAGRSRQEVESLIGFFVNTLALRIDLSGELTVTELLARVRQTALAAQEHQDLPFEQVVEIVQPPRQLAHTPLFQVMFAWQNNENTEWQLPGLVVSPADQDFDVVKFDLELNLSEEEGRIVGGLSYATALFDQSTIERHAGYLHSVLQAMVTHSQQRVGEIDILAPVERRLLLETWNATETAYPDALCIHQLFEQQAEKNPDAIALVHEDQTLSYAELNARANRLAHQLIALGVEPDQRVAICVARSPAMVVGLLAVMKAGGAYVPLDPAYSGERLTHILIDAAPVILLADNAGCVALGEKVSRLTVLDPNSLPDQPGSNPQVPALTARHLAYVIYTSGSTGTPKGVMVEHRGLVNLIGDKITQFDIRAGSRMLQFASFGFDASVWEIMMALCGGAALDIPVDTVRQDLRRLWHYLEEQAVTHACLTPALLRDGTDLPVITIKPTLILGGEAPSAALLQALSSQATLFNAYGPTEITVCATTWHCPSGYADTGVPIGRRQPTHGFICWMLMVSRCLWELSVSYILAVRV
ncbi:non-ribosomal peptide synthase/polyketide synthase [Photorhabdus hindustanensis]|uniref:non-ribosomal peptide synthase/polyketide synthase n=1 Tax=Photorhabdus hindustanensis TaxID=2918802 RepID=UPI001C613D5C|nr:non-ribosomal peptide synthase/polyketide synthase [Photorhabdus hindustanensis]